MTSLQTCQGGINLTKLSFYRSVDESEGQNWSQEHGECKRREGGLEILYWRIGREGLAQRAERKRR
eukprot:752929-Hanusia_phi.AAC.1